jgi:hypothetical protein
VGSFQAGFILHYCNYDQLFLVTALERITGRITLEIIVFSSLFFPSFGFVYLQFTLVLLVHVTHCPLWLPYLTFAPSRRVIHCSLRLRTTDHSAATDSKLNCQSALLTHSFTTDWKPPQLTLYNPVTLPRTFFSVLVYPKGYEMSART